MKEIAMGSEAEDFTERYAGCPPLANAESVTRSVILVDIDHTLSAAHWRDAMIGGPWDEYHAASVADPPAHDIAALVRALYNCGYTIIGITARPEKWRKLTMDWLLRHSIPLHSILMRPDAAYHPAPEIKVKLAQEHFGDALVTCVAFIIDDREDVVAAFRALGITTLQCHVRQS
jgi:hypothetical protein